MKNISDILRFDETIKQSKTTNFITETRDKLFNLKIILDLVENKKYNTILYGLIKLDNIWISQFEKVGLIRQNVKHLFIKLLQMDFIEEVTKTQQDYNELVDNLKVKPCDYKKIKLYKLTSKGFDYLATREIYDSLLLLLDKKNKNFVNETCKERNK